MQANGSTHVAAIDRSVMSSMAVLRSLAATALTQLHGAAGMPAAVDPSQLRIQALVQARWAQGSEAGDVDVAAPMELVDVHDLAHALSVSSLHVRL